MVIEVYAHIGDCQSAALVSRTGSIDWLCLPRFDSGACFAALLGTPDHGRWLLAPAGNITQTQRRYRKDTLVLEMHGEDFTTVAEFNVSEGQTRSFVLTWHPSHEPAPPPIDPDRAVKETEAWWREWSGRCTYQGEWREAVVRSLITLGALTYAPTGGIVAAATTSLPEKIGGQRNWDYRFCWVRDATFTLYSLLMSGYHDEARAWREWLLRAVAGTASQLNIMYGVAGERRLTEVNVNWLPGYENSTPVRIGNAAYQQFQLDVDVEGFRRSLCTHEWLGWTAAR